MSDPASAEYGKYLTAQEYRARFAPTSADVDAAEQWLKGAGLKVEGVGPDNHFVAVAGSPYAVEPRSGPPSVASPSTAPGDAATSTVTAPPTWPGRCSPSRGSNTLAHHVHPNSVARPDATGVEPRAPGQLRTAARVRQRGPVLGVLRRADDCRKRLPAFDARSCPYAACGYTPSQLRGAYGVTKSGLTGTGVTVAITDAFASNDDRAGREHLRHPAGGPAFAHGQFDQRNARGYDPQRVSDCGGNGWYGEETLDVEAVHGMAPDANVLYYGAASCYDDDLMAAMAQAVSDDQASMVTNSWGEPSYVVVDGNDLPGDRPGARVGLRLDLRPGAVQGIGFYYSSGDYGDDAAAWGVKRTDFPASDP